MSEIVPKTNTKLFGHEEAEAQFLRDFSAGKLAHGWIISGPHGIGKATLAYRFARALLARDGQTVLRIAAGSHADLLVIEPIYDEKKEEHAREISVEQARRVSEFLALTPGEGRWRVVIVDSADALNMNAANAILKILEEPPKQSVILLISNNQGKLLPTIRSRCRSLKLKALDGKQFSAVMRHIASDISVDELSALAQLSAYSPGLALDMHKKEAVSIYNQMLGLLAVLPEIDAGGLYAFADRMTAGQVHANWQLLTRLVLSLFERIAMRAAGAPYTPVLPGEAAVVQKATALHPAATWAAKWQQASSQFSLAEARHLDYKQVIITFFHSIASRESFQIGYAAA